MISAPAVSNVVAGTHDGAPKLNLNGTCAAFSSMYCTPATPSTLPISCGSLTVATVPCTTAARANSLGTSIELSMWTWASMKPGSKIGRRLARRRLDSSDAAACDDDLGRIEPPARDVDHVADHAEICWHSPSIHSLAIFARITHEHPAPLPSCQCYRPVRLSSLTVAQSFPKVCRPAGRYSASGIDPGGIRAVAAPSREEIAADAPTIEQVPLPPGRIDR